MRVAVVGLGKLGAPLAAVLAESGNDTVGADVDAGTVRLVNSGIAPVAEPGLQELVYRNRERLSATTDLAAAASDSEVTIMLVPTPSDERGRFSNAFLLDAITELGEGIAAADSYRVVVVSSTVMPGSCDCDLRAALEEASGRTVGDSLGLCYSPEFVALGNVIRGLREPDMVLIGESDARAGDVLERLYRGVCVNGPPFRRMGLVDAELAKIAVNTYVTMKISFANALADLCERLPGADVDVVTDALGLDTRIGSKCLRGAIAYGGPCFPRDNRAFAALARDAGAEPLLAEATDAVNAAQTERLARAVRSRLPPDGAVGILGLAYKPDTPVIDGSPGVELARRLADEGVAVVVYDPVATPGASTVLADRAACASSVAEVADRSDVVVIATPCPEFARVADAASRARGPLVVVDCWRLLADDTDPRAIELVRLGRAPREPSAVGATGKHGRP